MKSRIEIIPIPVVPDIKAGDKLDLIILESMSNANEFLSKGDIVVVAQKVISKAEGRLIDLKLVNPSEKSLQIAKQNDKDPRLIELILNESVDILRLARGIIIVETKRGLICANAGVDQSNVENSNHYATLLPEDADLSARELRHSFKRKTGIDVAVVITDTFGRPFREGQINVAIGIAGIHPIKSYIGTMDMYGKKLKVTEIAVVDEIASAAELQMGKSERIPVVIIRGYLYQMVENSSLSQLLRSKEKDLFR
ncbi:MAG TPA: coenzyme F420-0:L-glutamate ligase [Candidatus Nitrosopolaris rasttigaisensis]|nr:coenzyme F420-0:L-glutamate ligase [Candidatus Nitrosopolaris rasttigaisensis]